MIALLLLISIFCSYILPEQPKELVEVKEKYTILREHFVKQIIEKYHMLHRTIPITGLNE